MIFFANNNLKLCTIFISEIKTLKESKQTKCSVFSGCRMTVFKTISANTVLTDFKGL